MHFWCDHERVLVNADVMGSDWSHADSISQLQKSSSTVSHLQIIAARALSERPFRGIELPQLPSAMHAYSVSPARWSAQTGNSIIEISLVVEST